VLQEITGIFKNRYDRNLNHRQGFPVFNTIIEANYIYKREDVYDSFRLTEEDEREIRRLSSDEHIGEKVAAHLPPFMTLPNSHFTEHSDYPIDCSFHLWT
jgi:DNA replication licensing factor MCM2